LKPLEVTKLETTPDPQPSQDENEITGGEEETGGKPKEGKGENAAGKEGSDMTTLKVKGMTCQHCVMAVQKALAYLDGVQKIEVDLGKGGVRFENPKGISADKIREAIENAGYQVESA
jgi:copper chaperone